MLAILKGMAIIQKICPYFIALFLLSCSSVAQKAHARSNSDITIKRQYYELSYNESYEVANWVYYSLDIKMLQSCVKRENSFKPDPKIPTGSATLEDYQGSGYDRGHLLPAGDMKFNKQAMSDTFYLSNIAPQPAKFNRGLWASLEGLVRGWAYKYKKIWIVTGPVLHSGLPTIGRKNQVAVPDEFYKVIIRQEGNSYKGIGILMQTNLPYPYLAAYAVDIDTVEQLTGIDFFPFLTKAQERDAESTLDQSKWDFKAEFEYLPCQASAAR